MMPKLHSIGRVAGKHGYSGEISLVLDKTIATDKIKKGNFLFIEFDGKGVPFLIEQYRDKASVIKLADISNTADADELEGRRILLEEELLDITEQNEEQLLGFQLFHASGKLAGTISNVDIYPAGPMLVVSNNSGEFLVPFVADWIREVNKTEKKMTLDFPEELIP